MLTALTTLPMTIGQTASLLTLDSFWVSLILKIGVVLVMAFTLPLVGGYLEHKAMGRLQDRRGPVAAGPFGSLQLVADGIKFIQKEEVVPTASDKWAFAIAPGVALVPAILVFLVVPLGPGIWVEDLELGLFFALAIGSVSTIGVLMAGWSSANKFSLFGGIRAAAQLIAYELPLILAAAAVALQAGSLSLVDIVGAQGGFMLPGTSLNLWYVFPQALGFGLFFVAAMAELARPPFDMPIADSELVFGYMTEYTGIKFAMFLLTEYAGMISMSVLMVVLYLGGWQLLPGVPLPGCEGAAGLFDCGFWGTALGVGITIGKVMALVFLIVWLRVAYPRLREDQLQKMSWLVFIPLALVNLVVIAIGKVAA